MEKLTLILAFFITSLGVFAQEKTNDKSSTNDEFQISSEVTKKMEYSTKVCYAEESKTSFFEALLNENDFNIILKNSNALAVRSMEEIIKRRKNQRLYTEADKEENNN